MSQELKNYVGLRVKAARDAKGITQEQLAAKIEKTPETISNLERGSVMTGLETLDQITRVLNVPLASLFDGYDSSRKPSRVRLELENKLKQFSNTLADEDLKSAIALVEVVANRDKRP